MPHVRERRPFPDEPGSPVPGEPGDDARTTDRDPSTDAARETTANPGETPISQLVDDPSRSPGRVDAAEAVTGTRAGSAGEAPAGGIPGDDSSLEGGDPS